MPSGSRSTLSIADTDPDPSTYTVGWISAISTELVAAREFLDKEHSRLPNRAPNDNNIYTLGEIAGHNVVIAVLPDGEYGTSSAASVATDMVRTFKNIKIGLMVGVGGGAPSNRDDIRLGDVVVSSPRAGKSGVFQYDYGKIIQGHNFEHTRSLAPPPPLLLAAVNDLKGRFEADGHRIAQDIQAILEEKPRLRRKYGRPGQGSDCLYKPEYIHSDPLLSCEDSCGNGVEYVVCRRQRDEHEDNPTVHHGLIASSNQLMKDAVLRDKFVEEHHILCFEMEAAGLMNHFPCLVVRGICDYSDTHKDKRWQGYSAMTAAAYTKEVLRLIPPAQVQAEQSLATPIRTLDKRLRQVSSATDELMAAKANDAILKWLSPPDPYVNYQQALKGLEPESGSWYLTGHQFKKWKDSPSAILWTTGIPGSGKTSLSATAIRELWRTCIYFFFDFRDPTKRTLEQLLRSLVFQLYSKSSKAKAHDWLKRNLSTLMEGHESLNKRLFSALKEMLRRTNDAHIIIDALDESTTHQEMRWFLGSITVECNVRTLLTCRQSSYLDWFKQYPASDPPTAFWQQLRGPGLFREIETYVRRRVNDKNEAWSPGLSQAQIISGVCAKACGLFRLAVCQLDLLKSCVDEKDLQAELCRLPSTLNDIYSKSLERIPTVQRSRAMRLLSLLAHSTGQLSEKEAKQALAIRTGTGVYWENELDWRSINEVALGLTTETTVEIFGVQLQAIQLAHSSVRDFLLSQKKCSFWDLTQSKICVAKMCLSYLLQVSKENEETIGLFKGKPEAPRALLMKYPFSDWAAKHWMKVARPPEVQHAVMNQVIELLKRKSAFWFWRAIIRDTIPGNYSATLDVASYFDLVSIVEKLLYEGPTDDEIRSAFAAVCAQSNWKTAKVLSKSKVIVPLHLLKFVSSQGDFKLVKTLTTKRTTFSPEVYNALLSKTVQSLRGDYEKLIAYLILKKHARPSLHDFVHLGLIDINFQTLCLKKKTQVVELLTQNGLNFGQFTHRAIEIARTMRAHDIARLLLQQLMSEQSQAVEEYRIQQSSRRTRCPEGQEEQGLGRASLVGSFPRQPMFNGERIVTSVVTSGTSTARISVPRRGSDSVREDGSILRAPHNHGNSGSRFF